jgi:preprotein translocase subunit SecA
MAGIPGRALKHAKKTASCFPKAGLAREEDSVRRIRRFHQQLGLEDWSDLELKTAIHNARAGKSDGQPGLGSPDQVEKVFAIVNEAINRRLGAWKFFEQAWRRTRPKTSCQYHGEAFAFAETLADQEILEKAVKQVRAAGQGRFGPSSLLSADFYRAVRRLDSAGRYSFIPTDQQLLAGLHLLSNKIVEMQAGEGKTISIAFAAFMHAVLGRKVHVHTANDYLADRDCRLLAPLYASLGLTSGVILEPMDKTERRAAYSCDVVYGTVREFGFDYLRDNLVSMESERVQPVLQVAIVDEADQALIDEGDTPLIIAGPPSRPAHPWSRVDGAVQELLSRQHALCQDYLSEVERLSPGTAEHGRLLCLALLAAPFDAALRRKAQEHRRSYRRGLTSLFPDGGDVPDESLVSDLYYLVDERGKFVSPTEKGLALLGERLGEFCPQARGARRSEDTDQDLSRKSARQLQMANQVYQSLRAHLLLERDRDYVVTEDAVVLLDQHTGRTKPDNLYRHGLQAALEAKEGVTVHSDCESLAQISIQGFTNLYRSLSGISGTAQAAGEEFQRRYFLRVVSVPPARNARRVELPSRIYASEKEKIAGIVQEARRCQRFGRPVLVGAQSIGATRAISSALTEAGVQHRVLNAVTTEEEADIVRSAGQAGAVTVATNLAGRGTDIVPDPELDQTILDNWMRWILEDMRAGAGPRRAVCYTREEAEVLADALESRRELTLVRYQQGGRFYFSINSVEADPNESEACNDPTEWEFGLGLHVINAEFSRFPRVATQLKGRSGRQGMFGSGRQLHSWEDRWMVPLAEGKPAHGHQQRQDDRDAFFQEGRAVERFICRRQNEAEREAASARSVTSDYGAVCDAHTSAYYQLRQEVLCGNDLESRFQTAAQGCATALVYNHFPNLDPQGYEARFLRLSEEARLLYGIDVSILASESLDRLPGLVEAELLARLAGIRSRVGNEALQSLAKSLLLECGDCRWREHLADLQQAVFSSASAGHYHKASVADYILHARDMWDDFQRGLQEEFCSRLLRFPLELLEVEPANTQDSESANLELLSLMERTGKQSQLAAIRE